MATNGTLDYLGTSSNWSFGRKLLSMAHEHLHRSPLPTNSLLFDGASYDLGWDGMRMEIRLEPPVVPTLDFSIYLINAVKFHAGQLFHLFDEGSFMSILYAFHERPQYQMISHPLWYVHYLLILAFGKAFVVQRSYDNRPSGCEFFIKAMQLLPDISCLTREPMVATEILCCVALYFQALDYRSTAYSFVSTSNTMM